MYIVLSFLLLSHCQTFKLEISFQIYTESLRIQGPSSKIPKWFLTSGGSWDLGINPCIKKTGVLWTEVNQLPEVTWLQDGKYSWFFSSGRFFFSKEQKICIVFQKIASLWSYFQVCHSLKQFQSLNEVRATEQGIYMLLRPLDVLLSGLPISPRWALQSSGRFLSPWVRTVMFVSPSPTGVLPTLLTGDLFLWVSFLSLGQIHSLNKCFSFQESGRETHSWINS